MALSDGRREADGLTHSKSLWLLVTTSFGAWVRGGDPCAALPHARQAAPGSLADLSPLQMDSRPFISCFFPLARTPKIKKCVA